MNSSYTIICFFESWRFYVFFHSRRLRSSVFPSRTESFMVLVVIPTIALSAFLVPTSRKGIPILNKSFLTSVTSRLSYSSFFRSPDNFHRKTAFLSWLLRSNTVRAFMHVPPLRREVRILPFPFLYISLYPKMGNKMIKRILREKRTKERK